MKRARQIKLVCVGDANGASQRLVARSKKIHEGSRFPAF